MRNNFVENYESMSDDDIISLINGGKFELLHVIINRYMPAINFYVKKYCNANYSEDAIQEATFALYSAVKNYDNAKSSFSTFASICIKRSVISAIKSLNRKRNIPDELLSSIQDVEIADCNSPEKIFFDKENFKTLTDTIKLELSALEYKVLSLYLSGKRYSEISCELSISEKSVDNSLARIRKKLKLK